ncbi:response regulator transcription factor [Paenibacillus larvae]|nr:response regulator transcription factor [Paenibacillus larvae]MDT2294927.1 response regulator transcription factor [Paenibacillus larvae]
MITSLFMYGLKPSEISRPLFLLHMAIANIAALDQSLPVILTVNFLFLLTFMLIHQLSTTSQIKKTDSLYDELRRKHYELDEARRQLVDYAKMVEKTAQAEERRRISRALHDRESLRMLLGMQEELNVMGTCENGAEALKWLMEGNEADVILMDNRMPECDGVEGTKRIHEQFPSIKILVLATFDDDEFIIEALRNGACGYLLKMFRQNRLYMV